MIHRKLYAQCAPSNLVGLRFCFTNNVLVALNLTRPSVRSLENWELTEFVTKWNETELSVDNKQSDWGFLQLYILGLIKWYSLPSSSPGWSFSSSNRGNSVSPARISAAGSGEVVGELGIVVIRLLSPIELLLHNVCILKLLFLFVLPPVIDEATQ